MPSYTVVIVVAIAGALCLALMAAAARRWPGSGPWPGISKDDAQAESRESVQVSMREWILRLTLLQFLRERFGELPAAVVKRVAGGDPEWCENIIARANTANSLDELDLE